MSTYKNTEFIKVNSSKMVTVSVTMNLDEKAGDTVAMKNAVEAINYYLNTLPRQHKTWATKIEVK